MFCREKLGLDGFLKQGFEYRDEIENYKTSFISKMNDLAIGNSDQMIYTEDLKKLVALCQEEKKHLDLLITLIKKYEKVRSSLTLFILIYTFSVVCCFT